jgi:hypothetical protein
MFLSFYPSICDFHLCSAGNLLGSSLVIKIACAKRRSIEFMRSVHSFLTEHSTCISLNP